jgi:hypothetical protein
MIKFIQTMEVYSYSVAKLFELLIAFFQSYSALMKSRASLACQQSILADEGNPMTVHNMTELNQVQAIFTENQENGQELSGNIRLHFPMTFAYSAAFLACCDEVQKFIDGFYMFGEGFNQQFAEMDIILKKDVETLLTDCICPHMESKMAMPNIQLSELVRIIMNLKYFELAVEQMEETISVHRASHRSVSPRNAELKAFQDKQMASSLSAVCSPRFLQCRKKAEHRIFEVINRKIDDFLECATYDFMPADPSKSGSSPQKKVVPVSNEPSAYLVDLINFLNTVWTSTLSELPMFLKSPMYYDAIYHISAELLAKLLDPTVRKISPYFIEQTLERDVSYLENFVKELGDVNLLDQMAQIKQVIELLRLATPVEEYLNPTIKSRKYSQLPKQTAVVLLEKLRDSGAYLESSGFFGLMKDSSASAAISSNVNEKKLDKGAKRRNLDMVIRQLREESAPVKK